jgi:hypothetical protein
MSWIETRDFLSMIRGLLKVEPVTIEMHQAGIDLAERYGLSVYDAMIASAALLTECDTLFTEDLQDGLLVSGRLRVVNPFNRPGPERGTPGHRKAAGGEQQAYGGLVRAYRRTPVLYGASRIEGIGLM